jgi:hypothetical protein
MSGFKNQDASRSEIVESGVIKRSAPGRTTQNLALFVRYLKRG